LSDLLAKVPWIVKIDVEAVGRMLDELLAAPAGVMWGSEFEDLEPDYECLELAVRRP
jgi:hypothetical protein